MPLTPKTWLFEHGNVSGKNELADYGELNEPSGAFLFRILDENCLYEGGDNHTHGFVICPVPANWLQDPSSELIVLACLSDFCDSRYPDGFNPQTLMSFTVFVQKPSGANREEGAQYNVEFNLGTP
jgi:hypothetical protein